MNIWRTRPGISQISFDFSIIIIARLTAVIECTDIRKSPRKVRSGLISVISGAMSIVGVEAKNTIIQDRVGVLSPGAVFSVHRCRKGSDF